MTDAEQEAALTAAHAKGATEAASLCTQYAVMLPAEATEARQVALDLATAILANAGCLPGDDIKVEQAGPETRSWVQALTAKWPAGDPAPRQGQTPIGPAKVATVDDVKNVYSEGLMVGQGLGKKLGAAEERAAVVAHLTEGADLAGPGDARRVLLAASDGIKHGEHRREGEGYIVVPAPAGGMPPAPDAKEGG